MNKRIKELALQAGEEAVKSVPFFRTGRCQIPSWVNVFIEVRDKKFAELIVKECIRCCEGNSEYKNHTDTEWGKGLASGIGLCKEAMKTHFGVGE